MNRQAILDRLKAEAPELHRKYGVKSLALFGSVNRGDDEEGSDVDVLFTFEPGRKLGLFGFVGLQIELSDLLGRKVDLNTPDDLSPYFRANVIGEAQTCYEAY